MNLFQLVIVNLLELCAIARIIIIIIIIIISLSKSRDVVIAFQDTSRNQKSNDSTLGSVAMKQELKKQRKQRMNNMSDSPRLRPWSRIVLQKPSLTSMF